MNNNNVNNQSDDFIINGVANDEALAVSRQLANVRVHIEQHLKSKEVHKRLNHENQEDKAAYSTVDHFIDCFEAILHQHEIDQNMHWKRCFVSTVIHNHDRLTWYNTELKNKDITWEDAKVIIKNKYGGKHSKSAYLTKIQKMKVKNRESPVDFADRFMNNLINAGIPDGVAFDDRVLNILYKSKYKEVAGAIQQSYSQISEIDGRTELNVDFIRRKLPILYIPETYESDEISMKNLKDKRPKVQNTKHLPTIEDKPFNFKQIQELKLAGKCTSCTKNYSKEHRCSEYIQDKAAREIHKKKDACHEVGRRKAIKKYKKNWKIKSMNM
ncbi:uncharacterized protein BX664DRAFT_387142 [Halteromyces radiatus]|uniref:uncharacterized protein n=1 Tax=Halteromyces radiatus TaxID=101107 RepID=UPI00221E415D|nr:uncharacterized protein BX664DRAFT_387142 [Halteromyces radiatus]KAI8086779.1 hypothetical protein BX664DRAFT_387142 [Halteromyces radiatus]